MLRWLVLGWAAAVVVLAVLAIDSTTKGADEVVIGQMVNVDRLGLPTLERQAEHLSRRPSPRV